METKTRRTVELTTSETTLYESRGTLKVRLLTWGMLIFWHLCLLAGYWVSHNLIGDETTRELAPHGIRLAVGLLIPCFGLPFFLGMLAYQKYYATRLVYLAQGDEIRVHTLALFGERERTIPVSRIESASYHRGKLHIPGGVYVDAPWFWVRVREGRSFLLDVNGQFSHDHLLKKVLSGDQVDE